MQIHIFLIEKYSPYNLIQDRLADRIKFNYLIFIIFVFGVKYDYFLETVVQS